jgi:hypothetical protein
MIKMQERDLEWNDDKKQGKIKSRIKKTPHSKMYEWKKTRDEQRF